LICAAVASILGFGALSAHAECTYGPDGACESEQAHAVVSLWAIVGAHHSSSYKHPGYSSIELVSTPEAAYMTATEPRTRTHLRWLTEEAGENVVKVPWECKRPHQTFRYRLTARGQVGDTVTTHVTFHAQLSSRWCAASKARDEAQRLAAQREREAEHRAREERERHSVESTCTNGTYVNSRGNTVCKPEESPSGPPEGATAECEDGTYSFSESRSGTCSSHGGVARWL
jgi:Protein of unknown function (DUF3761)